MSRPENRVPLRPMPPRNPYIPTRDEDLREHARRLERALREERDRTPEELLTLHQDIAWLLQGVFVRLNRRATDFMGTWGGAPPPEW